MLNPDQYSNSHKYDARLYLNKHFKTNSESKANWLFGFFPKKENIKVLELGCGTGLFWLANKNLIPESWKIILSDYSEGMLKETQKNLSPLKHHFEYAIVNAQSIDYPANHFDVVLANNMLYHVEDITIALTQIKRTLKKDGIFIAATQGKNDMKELNDILYSFLVNKGQHHIFRERAFSMDNGLKQLRPFFTEIQIKRFDNKLRITEVEPIINYFSSFSGIANNIEVLPERKIEGFKEYLQIRMDRDKAIIVNKDTGAFICSNE